MLDRNSYVPLYCQLADEIQHQIESGQIKPGDKLPSESEMIQIYNIGRPTVRMALSQLVNKGYLAKEHGRGTFCKTAKVAEEALNIDVILDMSDTYFIPYYMKSICQVLADHKCNFIVNDSNNSTPQICALLRNILQKGTSGVILQSSHNHEPVSEELEECFRMYRNAGVPYLMIDCAYDVPDSSYTMLDEEQGGYLAGKYLQELGHTNVLAISMPAYKDSLLRLEGFCRAYTEAGLPQPSNLAYRKEEEENKPFGQQLLRCLDTYHPTAIFCYNDEMAVECIRILRNSGIRVPEDISVLGFDDSVLAETCVPPLTTVVHPKQELGKQAAQALLDLIYKKQSWPYVYLFAPKLVIRESCIPCMTNAKGKT